MELLSLQFSIIRFVAVFLLLAAVGVGSYQYQVLRECRYNSPSLEGTEFIDRHIFNKLEFLRYNSTLNKYIGYTEFGVKNAERLNNDPSELAGLMANVDGYCKHNAKLYYDLILGSSVEPRVTLRSAKSEGAKNSYMLTCNAFGFYPRQIKVTWLKNGEKVKSGVTSTDEFSNGDWYYQIYSQLEVVPLSGETYSCRVEHVSLSKPITLNWDPSMPESDKNKIIIGISGLILGLVIASAGFIYYKKKATGRILVPTS